VRHRGSCRPPEDHNSAIGIGRRWGAPASTRGVVLEGRARGLRQPLVGETALCLHRKTLGMLSTPWSKCAPNCDLTSLQDSEAITGRIFDRLVGHNARHAVGQDIDGSMPELAALADMVKWRR
jgi:hypothetical protein